MIEKIELAHILSSFGLTVLIWIIQLLHYPSFLYFEDKQFIPAMQFHQKVITPIVVPLMLAELITSLWLCWFESSYLNITIGLIVLGIWATTFFIQVPIHSKLSQGGKNIQLIQLLIKSNWIRTALWTLKLILILSLES